MDSKPSQELSHDETRQIERVQQIILALEKCTRAQKLYLPNNQILTKHKEQLHQQFSAYLKEFSELKLRVTASKFLFLAQAVYYHENKKESFAYRLYNEGMRAINFTHGLDTGELNDFMTLLNQVTQDGGVSSNSATLLWEKEFHHISYEIAEYIIDQAAEQVIQGRVEEILEPSMEKYQGPAPMIGPPEDIEEALDSSTLLPQHEFKRIAREVCVLDAKEFEQIQREIAYGEKHERLMMDLFDIMLTLILEERNPDELNKLYQILLDTIDASVLHGELHITSQFLWALRGMLEGGSGDFSMRHPDRILRVIESLGSFDRINRYLNCLNLGFTGSVKDIVNFFGSLPKQSFPILLQQIHVVSSPQLRKEISIAIAQIYDYEVEHFIKAFKVAKAPNQLQDILFILTHTRDARVAQYLQPLLTHESKAVRLAAIHTLRDLETKEACRQLRPLLDDNDAEIRMNAVRAIGNAADPEIGRSLLTKIQANDFTALDLQDKHHYFAAAAKLLGDEMLTYLKTVLDDNPIFRKKEMDEMHQCAAFALSSLGTEPALQMLKQFETSGSKNVRQHCQRELKRLGGGAAA